MRLSVQNALVDEIDLDNTPVDRADDTEGSCRNFASRVTEYQEQNQEQDRCESGGKNVQKPKGQIKCHGGQYQEGNAFTRNKRISSSFHNDTRR